MKETRNIEDFIVTLARECALAVVPPLGTAWDDDGNILFTRHMEPQTDDWRALERELGAITPTIARHFCVAYSEALRAAARGVRHGL